MEKKLLKLLLKHQFYNDNKFRTVERFFPDALGSVYKSIVEAHAKYGRDITLDELEALYRASNPTATRATRQQVIEAIQEIQEVGDVGEDIASDVFSHMWRAEVGRQIAEVGLDIADGKEASLQKVVSIIERTQESFLPKDEVLPITTDIEELLTLDDTRARWAFNIPSLAEAVPGLAPGEFAIALARPECFPGDVELLTEFGWCRFDKYSGGVKVAQVNPDRSVRFVSPDRYVSWYNREPMYRFTDGLQRLDVCVTAGHEMVYERAGALVKTKASEVTFKAKDLLHTAFNLTPFSGFRCLSPVERLLIAFQADGTMPKDANTGIRCGARTVRITVKKQRKINRLTAILNATGFEWYLDDEGKDKRTFYIKWPLDVLQPTKLFDWVNATTRTPEWGSEFVEEASYWDATRRTDTRYKYDTTVPYNAEVLQLVATIAGYSVNYSVYKDKRGYKDIHTLSILTHYKPIEGQCVKKEKVNYEGQVYCVTVPSGMIMVRSNRQTLVIGNCGKTALGISLAAAPGGWCHQGANVHYIGNEEPVIRSMKRAIESCTGMTWKDVKENPATAKRLFDPIRPKLTMLDDVDMSIEKLDLYCRRNRPDILIIDQLDKLAMGGQYSRSDEYLQELYIQARRIAKRHNLGLWGVTQASAEAEGKTRVTYAMAANSKTGKAAEADLVIGVGKAPINEGGSDDDPTRFLTLSKNKITGNHSTVVCVLDKYISRYEA